MSFDADQARAVDRLEIASDAVERARRRLARAEQDRARAVAAAQDAGLSLREIAPVLGITHTQVARLGRSARPELSATGRGAPEPTPVGVLLAELAAASPAATEPDPSATEWAAECADFGCHDPSADMPDQT